jgi:hypothetical protein
MTSGEMRFVAATGGGRYQGWLKGSFDRPRVYLDSSKVGEAREIDTQGQWEGLRQIELERRVQRVGLERPQTVPAPGDPWRGVSGPVALERIASSALTTVAPKHASRSCTRGRDWIELVRS